MIQESKQPFIWPCSIHAYSRVCLALFLAGHLVLVQERVKWAPSFPSHYSDLLPSTP